MQSEEHSNPEDRYFHIQIIAKESLEEGRTLDTFWDHVEAFFPECVGDTCTCGIESFGGGSGTLDQAFRSHGIADDIEEVNPADVRIVLDFIDKAMVLPEVREAASRLRERIDWWPNVLKSIAEDEEEEQRWEDDGGTQLP